MKDPPKPIKTKKKTVKTSKKGSGGEPSPASSRNVKVTSSSPEKKRKPEERFEGVKVQVRLRSTPGDGRVLGVNGTTIFMPGFNGLPDKHSEVDKCFMPDVEISAVHKEVAHTLLPSIRSGYDTTLLLVDTDTRPEQTASLLTRMCLSVYQHLIEDSDHFKLTLSMYELEGDRVRDLFVSAPEMGMSPAPFDIARVRWSPTSGPWVVGVLKRDISSATDCAHAIASASIRSSKPGTHQTVFKMEITRTNLNEPLTHSHVMQGTNTRTSTVTIMDMGQPTAPSGELSTSLNALGKVISGLTGSQQSISFKLSPSDISQIARETHGCHMLGEVFNGNCCTTILATVSQANKDLEETVMLLQLLEKARNITNRVWVNSIVHGLHVSCQRVELCKMSAADELDTSHANIEASDLLNTQLRELEQRQAEMENLENSILQTSELRQLAEYEKLQKERTQAEKRRVEDSAKMLVVAATKGQQQAVDQYAVAEIQNRQLMADNRQLEKTLEGYVNEITAKEAAIESLKLANEKLTREKGLEEERAEAARRNAAQDRKMLLMDNTQLMNDLRLAQQAADQHRQAAESIRNEIEHMKLDRRLAADDIQLNKDEYIREIAELKKLLKQAEDEKASMAYKNAEMMRELKKTNSSLADEMEDTVVSAKGVEMNLRRDIMDLETEKDELKMLLKTEEATTVRELGRMQEKKEAVEMELEKVKEETKDSKAVIAAYKTEVEAQWSVEREALISCVSEGCQILSEFIKTIPELEGSLDTMTAWMSDLNLSKYIHLLQAHGVKDMKGISLLTEESLTEMQVTGVARRRILEAAEQVVPQERDKTIVTALYSWMDMLHFRLTGEPAPCTPLQQTVAKPFKAPKKGGPAFHQVKQSSGLWASPHRTPQVRKYAQKNEVHLEV